MLKNILLLIGICFTLTIACSKDDPEPEDSCSTFSDTYSGSIKNIIDQNCATSGCHDGTNPRPAFTDYDKVFARRADIRSRTVATSMPPPTRPALSQSDIDKIDCWVSNGAPQ